MDGTVVVGLAFGLRGGGGGGHREIQTSGRASTDLFAYPESGDTLRVAVSFGSAAMVRGAAAVVMTAAAVVKAPEGSACAAMMSGWAGGWW